MGRVDWAPVSVDGRGSHFFKADLHFFHFHFLGREGGRGGGNFNIKYAIVINLRTDAKISLLIQSGSQKSGRGSCNYE